MLLIGLVVLLRLRLYIDTDRPEKGCGGGRGEISSSYTSAGRTRSHENNIGLPKGFKNVSLRLSSQGLRKRSRSWVGDCRLDSSDRGQRDTQRERERTG